MYSGPVVYPVESNSEVLDAVLFVRGCYSPRGTKGLCQRAGFSVKSLVDLPFPPLSQKWLRLSLRPPSMSDNCHRRQSSSLPSMEDLLTAITWNSLCWVATRTYTLHPPWTGMSTAFHRQGILRISEFSISWSLGIFLFEPTFRSPYCRREWETEARRQIPLPGFYQSTCNMIVL